MKKLMSFLGVALMQISFGSSAVRAGDELMPANSNWSGIYLGGQIGGFWSNTDGSFVSDASVTFNPTPSGGIGGVVLGFQHQIGSIVLGIEGDYLDTFNDDNGSDTCHPVNECLSTATLEGKISRMWTVGPRLGWDAGHWMPYVTGGYASASIAVQSFVLSTPYDHTNNRFDGW